MDLSNDLGEVFQADTLCLKIDFDLSREQVDAVMSELQKALKVYFKKAGMVAADITDVTITTREDLYIPEASAWIEPIDGQYLCNCSIPLVGEVDASVLTDEQMDHRYEFDYTLLAAFRRSIDGKRLEVKLGRESYPHEDKVCEYQFIVGIPRPYAGSGRSAYSMNVNDI